MITNRIDNIHNNLQKMVNSQLKLLRFTGCYKYGFWLKGKDL